MKTLFWLLFVSLFIQYVNMTRLYSEESLVTEDLLKALIQAESEGNPNAVSPVGARGLCQFMESTWKDVWCRILKQPEYASFDYAFDPNLSQKACIAYLKWLEKQLKKAKLHNLDNLLASYNAGLGVVKANKGVPNYTETVKYVKKIKKTLEKQSKQKSNHNSVICVGLFFQRKWKLDDEYDHFFRIGMIILAIIFFFVGVLVVGINNHPSQITPRSSEKGHLRGS